MLGMGTNIQDPSHLPTMDAEGKAPKDLGAKYGKIIMEADGFAQVRPAAQLPALLQAQRLLGGAEVHKGLGWGMTRSTAI